LGGKKSPKKGEQPKNLNLEGNKGKGCEKGFGSGEEMQKKKGNGVVFEKKTQDGNQSLTKQKSKNRAENQIVVLGWGGGMRGERKKKMEGAFFAEGSGKEG